MMTQQPWSWRARATAVILVVATGACGNAERRAAEARADSLQATLQRQRDSLNAAREKAAAQATQAGEQRRREDSLKTARRQAVADSLRAERSRPRDLALMNTTGVSIGPQKYADYVFVLDSSTTDCNVHGRIETLEGGTNKDVEVFLFAADDFTNWRNNHSVTPLFHTGRQTVTTLNAAVTQGGEYHLVVSNYFSTVSRKTVRGQVTVTCRGLQPRQP